MGKTELDTLLRTYWAGVADSVREQARGRDPQEVLSSPDIVVWVTLGAPRPAMLVTRAPCGGSIPSKTEAGRWVVDNLPDHADLARRALFARAGEPVTCTVADGRQSTDLVMLLVHGHG